MKASSLLLMGIPILEDIGSIPDSLEQRAIDEYNQSLRLPRKKKKIAKRSALMSYSIAQWTKNITTFNFTNL